MSQLQRLKVNISQRAGFRSGLNEAHYLYQKLLLKRLSAAPPVRASDLWLWLQIRYQLNSDSTFFKTDEIKEKLLTHATLMREVVEIALANLSSKKQSWEILNHLRQATLNAVDEDDLLEWIADSALSSEKTSRKKSRLFELALLLSFRSTARALSVFERLSEHAQTRPTLRALRDRTCTIPIEDWRVRDIARAADQRKKASEEKAKLRRRFKKEKEQIKAGNHTGWLAYLGRLYFAQFSGVDRDADPDKRFADALGLENVEIAKECLLAGLSRGDLATLDDVARTSSEMKMYPHWYGLLAGLTEYTAQGLSLDAIPDQQLESIVAIDCVTPTFAHKQNHATQIHHDWLALLYQRRPQLLHKCYLALVHAGLERKSQNLRGLYQLIHRPEFQESKVATAFDLVEQYPEMPRADLESLIRIILEANEKERLSNLIKENVTKSVGKDSHGLWLALGYVTAPEQYKRQIENFALAHPEITWALRSISGFKRHQSSSVTTTLTVAQMGFIATLVGQQFKYCSHPNEGWVGDSNAWDATEFVCQLINYISSEPSSEAHQILKRLLSNKRIKGYQRTLKHALAEQQMRHIDSSFKQPTWQQAVTSLSGGAAANIAELHALVLFHLNDLKNHISFTNTDVYKRFWNEDSHGKIKSPKVEESCRDVLVDLLRQRLRGLEAHIEPEGHMAVDKRVDIAIMPRDMKLVVELKRDHHAEVWTAAQTQLARFYTRDPQAKGYGIYGIFWFGPGKWTSIPKPPKNKARPNTAAEMEYMLNSLVPIDKRSQISAIVIDVSKPPA